MRVIQYGLQGFIVESSIGESTESHFVQEGLLLACVVGETKPRYSPCANQRPKACSVPRVLPGFSIIGSNWLLHMAVLSFTVIGRVDLMEPWLRWWLRSRLIPDTQNKHDGDTWRGIIKCKSFTDMLFGVANAMVCLFSLPL